jgi:hypothetical protein
MGKLLAEHTPDSPFVGALIPHFIPAGTDQWQIVNRGDAILGKHNIMGRYIYGNKFGASFNDPKDALWNVGINDGGNTTKARLLGRHRYVDCFAGGFGHRRIRLSEEPVCTHTSPVSHVVVRAGLRRQERS